MPKKYKIEQKRKWLQYREDQGKSDKWIANNFKCDARTVTNGIDEVLREREAGAAKIQLIKDKISDHQKELLVVLDGIVSMLELPAYNMEIRRYRDGRIAPISLSGAIVKTNEENELTLVIENEDSLKWGLLKEHLKSDKLWKLLGKWKDPFLEHIKARVVLMGVAQELLEEETGLRLIGNPNQVPETVGIFPAVVQTFYDLAICRALDIRNETNLEESLVATDDGYVNNTLAGSGYAYTPGAQEECKTKILVALENLYESEVLKQVIKSFTETGRITDAARRTAEEISLMRWLPGRCRVCKRMGV